MLNCLWTRGATVGLKTGKWTRAKKLDALERGSHQSACQHSDFLCEEFVEMIQKGQWVLLPAHMVLDEENLLPKGWMQSPPLFTAATETVADLANQQLQAN
jgi:hypothetical protein